MRGLLLLLLATMLSAEASTPSEARRCLAANDVPCADDAIAKMGAAESTNPDLVALAAETAFYAGRYDEAYALVQKATNAGWKDQWGELGLYQRTADVMKDWAQVRRGNFVVRYRPGVDAILIEDALDVLEAAEKHITPLLGEGPPGPTILEIYPDGRSFIACSSLTEKDVRTTGVVALSKWSRLLLTSPRALGRGYEWKDTVAHEYIHLVVSHQTDDRAPVWLQEAIARYLDNRWRDGSDRFRLSVRDQGLLEAALKEEAGQIAPDKAKEVAKARERGESVHVGLVPFDVMHPSLAKLPSASMAALAYAQLSSLMAFTFAEGGDQVLEGVLADIRGGTDPRIALSKAAGRSSFEVLLQDWKRWANQLDLEGRDLAEMPTVLDGADEAASDPVMAGRADLQRWLRLGDLLREEGHPKAALVEYAKAIVPNEPESPLLANRIAQAHLELGDMAAARAALERSLENYPEFALSWKTLGQIQQKEGQTRAALFAWKRAADLNPFDPAVQGALVELHRATGDAQKAQLHENNLRILRRGGLEADEVTLIRELSETTR